MDKRVRVYRVKRERSPAKSVVEPAPVSVPVPDRTGCIWAEMNLAQRAALEAEAEAVLLQWPGAGLCSALQEEESRLLVQVTERVPSTVRPADAMNRASRFGGVVGWLLLALVSVAVAGGVAYLVWRAL